MYAYMPKNANLPQIYQTREKLTHTCLYSGPFMPQMMHTCTMHNVCIVDTQDLYTGNIRSGISILETQDLYSGNTRSVICIVETQDLYSGNARSVICILDTQDMYSVFTRQRLDGPYKSRVAEWCPFIYFSQKYTFL